MVEVHLQVILVDVITHPVGIVIVLPILGGIVIMVVPHSGGHAEIVIEQVCPLQVSIGIGVLILFVFQEVEPVVAVIAADVQVVLRVELMA